MRKTLAIKYLAYHRIQRVLTENPGAVTSTTALTGAKTAFDAQLNALDDILVPEVGATIPNTDLKNETFVDAVDQLMPVCDGLLLYAEAESDPVLAGQVPGTPTGLRAGNEVSQVQRFWTVLNAAKAIPADSLAPYGIVAAQLTALETLLTSLDGMVGSPRSAIDARMLKRSQQEAAFEDMDDFLANSLDRAVRNRQPNFPDFVSAYFLARKLHDMPSQPVEEELEALKKEATAPPAPTSEQLQQALNTVELTDNGVPAMNGAH